jgi:hypothetical protein
MAKSGKQIRDNEEERGGRPRAYVPVQIMKVIGSRIKVALENEHLEYCNRQGRGTTFNYIRFVETTKIPYNTIRAITSGQRVPSIFDILEIARFTGFTVDQLLNALPTNAALRRLWEEEQSEIYQIRKQSFEREQEARGLFKG